MCRLPVQIETADRSFDRSGPLQLPGSGTVGAGIVDTEVASLDGSCKMMAQRDITAADLRDRSLDCLGHHQTRPFTVRSGLAKSSAQPNGGGELIAKRLQLTAETSSSVAVVEPIGFRQFLAQLANTLSILLAGPGVEHSACIAQ